MGPVLVYPQEKVIFILDIDYSENIIGEVLFPIHEEQEVIG